MSPEFTKALVTRWVRCYTLGLPAAVRRRRVSEITADLHDQIGHERARGTSDRVIAAGILSRMARGFAADVSWRSAHATTITGIVLVAAFLLSLPLVAMQLTEEVAWAPGDFAAAGALIVGTGLLQRAAARRAGDLAYRAAVAVALAATFLLVWATLAVGIIGEPGEPANAIYVGVLAVGILGAVSARFRPAGMARAMLATALVQALAAGIALIIGDHEAAGSSVAEILALNGLFAALFITSALLFRRAARLPPIADQTQPLGRGECGPGDLASPGDEAD